MNPKRPNKCARIVEIPPRTNLPIGEKGIINSKIKRNENFSIFSQ